MKLDIPYYSQFLDVPDEYWKSRSCGMACLKMVLDHHKAKTPALYDMVKRGKEEGGHTPFGWLHDYSLGIARGYGFQADRREKMDVESSLGDFVSRLGKNEPIIVSVFRNFSEKDKFHQVVLTGFEEDEGKLSGLYFHDPDSRDRESKKHLFIPISIFIENWRRMAIFISP